MTSLKDEKVCVTGANGFIGYHLVSRLIQEGAIVHAFTHKNEDRIYAHKNHCNLHRVNLLDEEALHRLMKNIRPRTVFHLAALVNVDRSPELIDELMGVNFQGTVNLLRASSAVGYECFVNTGTCEEYGDNPAPFLESQCPRPVSPYSLSKASATLYCSMLVRTQNLPIVTLRPFLVYGPFQTSQMLIPETIRNALNGVSLKFTGGEQTREFNFVDDIVEGYIKAATTPVAHGEVINIGNGKEYTIRQVVEKILSVLDNPAKPLFGALPYRAGEAWHFYCDNTKARQLLGWDSKIGLDEGLSRTTEWFLENPTKWKN